MTTAIILAAGKGKRMDADKNKVFLLLKDPIIAHTIKAFEQNKNIKSIIVVCGDSEIEDIQDIVDKYNFKKVKKIVTGGKTRQQSCYNGVYACADCDYILIHDGVRPLVSQEIIDNSIKDAIKYTASVVGVPLKDTIKRVSGDFVETTLQRDGLFRVQTPQTFKGELIRKAHEKAHDDGFFGTDDSSLLENIGVKVKLTLGSYDNIKITTPDDLKMAETILK